MKKKSNTVNYHMTLSDRIAIEQGPGDGKTFKEIAAELHRDPTTISKEVKRAIGYEATNTAIVNCRYVQKCRRRNSCLGTDCSAYCKN